jgi:hypothetical protein
MTKKARQKCQFFENLYAKTPPKHPKARQKSAIFGLKSLNFIYLTFIANEVTKIIYII